MRPATFVWIVILLLVLGGGGWYWYTHPNAGTPEKSSTLVASANYTCTDNSTVHADYYSGTSTAATADPPVPGGHVELTFGSGTTMSLPQTISADGGRYANPDESYVFWSKGDDAMIQQNGTTTATCTQTASQSHAMGINGSPNQGNMGDAGSGAPSQPQGDGTDVSQNLILGVSDNGKYLTAYNGMTVYSYDRDSATASGCSGTCAQKWPPYTVPSAAAIHTPATLKGAVGTITRADGSLQVTYEGKPLYFYASDTAAGEVKGDGVGGVWHLVTP